MMKFLFNVAVDDLIDVVYIGSCSVATVHGAYRKHLPLSTNHENNGAACCPSCAVHTDTIRLVVLELSQMSTTTV